MEAIIKKRRNRTQRIDYYVSILKNSQPEVLENGLKTMFLRVMAQKLDKYRVRVLCEDRKPS